jgi:hypothetical protein
VTGSFASLPGPPWRELTGRAVAGWLAAFGGGAPGGDDIDGEPLEGRRRGRPHRLGRSTRLNRARHLNHEVRIDSLDGSEEPLEAIVHHERWPAEARRAVLSAPALAHAAEEIPGSPAPAGEFEGDHRQAGFLVSYPGAEGCLEDGLQRGPRARAPSSR